MKWIERFRRKSKQLITPRNVIYIDNKGRKWYAVDATKLHTSRALMAWLFSRDSQYSLSKEKLKTAIDKMRNALNEKDLVAAAQILGVVDAATELYCEESILLNLACCYSQVENEPEEFQDEWQKEKKKIWAEDFLCRSFFLQWGLQFMPKLGESPDLNVLSYLDQAKPTLDLINYHLTTMKSTATE